MAKGWSLEALRELPPEKLQTLYRNARAREDADAKKLVELIDENDLYREADGGLPFDHPIMLEIEEICRDPEAVREAVNAAENGLPALAGMEYRIVEALGPNYGTHYTTHHAGRCIADEMLSKGWQKVGQKPMPEGTVARSATVFVKRGND
jgi:hypothetical protein